MVRSRQFKGNYTKCQPKGKTRAQLTIYHPETPATVIRAMRWFHGRPRAAYFPVERSAGMYESLIIEIVHQRRRNSSDLR